MMLAGMARCSPAGARKNWRATWGPLNRVLPYQRYSPSAAGSVRSTGAPDGAMRDTAIRSACPTSGAIAAVIVILHAPGPPERLADVPRGSTTGRP